DDTGRVDLPEPVVVLVDDVHVPRAVGGETAGEVQLGAGGRAAVAAEAVEVAAGDGGDDTRGVDLPDAVVVADVDVPCAVDRQRLQRPEGGRAGRAAVPGERPGPVAGDRGQDAVRRDLEDPAGALVGQVEVAGAVGRDGGRARVDLRGGFVVPVE